MPVRGPRRLRSYTTTQKAEALAALSVNTGSVLGLAQELDIPAKTLDNWKKGIGINQDVANVAHIKKEEIRDLHKLIVIKSLGLLQTKLKDCSGQQLSTIAGISTDKMQLMDGAPTSINENRDHLNPVAVAAYAKKRGISLELADAELTQTADEMGLTSELTQ